MLDESRSSDEHVGLVKSMRKPFSPYGFVLCAFGGGILGGVTGGYLSFLNDPWPMIGGAVLGFVGFGAAETRRVKRYQALQRNEARRTEADREAETQRKIAAMYSAKSNIPKVGDRIDFPLPETVQAETGAKESTPNRGFSGSLSPRRSGFETMSLRTYAAVVYVGAFFSGLAASFWFAGFAAYFAVAGAVLALCAMSAVDIWRIKSHSEREAAHHQAKWDEKRRSDDALIKEKQARNSRIPRVKK